MGPVPLISGAEALVAPGRIHPIFLEGKLLPLQGSPAAELGLKEGQVIQATVRSQHGQPMLISSLGKRAGLATNNSSPLRTPAKAPALICNCWALTAVTVGLMA